MNRERWIGEALFGLLRETTRSDAMSSVGVAKLNILCLLAKNQEEILAVNGQRGLTALFGLCRREKIGTTVNTNINKVVSTLEAQELIVKEGKGYKLLSKSISGSDIVKFEWFGKAILGISEDKQYLGPAAVSFLIWVWDNLNVLPNNQRKMADSSGISFVTASGIVKVLIGIGMLEKDGKKYFSKR